MKDTKKFIMSIDISIFNKLGKISEKRGVSVQQLIRTIIIPDWIQKKG